MLFPEQASYGIPALYPSFNMPSASDFKRRFGLHPGARLGDGLAVAAVDMGHLVKREHELYHFPTTVAIKLDEGTQSKHVTGRRLLAAFRRHVAGGERELFSAYGSPYACTITGAKVASLHAAEGHAVLEFTGQARRRRDVPTLAQGKEAERKRKGAGGDVSEAGECFA